MRKIALVLVGLVIAVPMASSANDVPDGKDCRSKDQTVVKTAANGASEADRFAVCVTVADQTLVYAGGELQSEDKRNDGFMGTCGAIIVADQPVASGKYGEDWDTKGPDGKAGTSDDFHC